MSNYFKSINKSYKEHSDTIKCWLAGAIIIAILSGFATLMFLAVSGVVKEASRIRSLLNKPGVVTVYESEFPKKIVIRTLDYKDKMFLCRVDNGMGSVPRFSESRFYESEIKFIGIETE